MYLETVRCFFSISEEELEKCRYNYKGKDTYAFVMSDKYIMALYTYCLSARKAGCIVRYRAGRAFGNGAFYGKIRECQGSIIPGIVT